MASNASLRPSAYPELRQRSRSPGVEKLQAHREEPRHRSRSRTPKPYFPDTPRRYGPNESRLRKPPQSPTIEDLGLEDDGVRSRGKPDQKPVIIPTDSDGDSSGPNTPSQTSEPATPPSSDEEPKSKNGGKAPFSSARPNGRGGPQERASASTPISTEEAPRGRQGPPKLDTGIEKLPRLERERSPYSSGPRDTKGRENRFSTDSLLSPTLPRAGDHHGTDRRSHSQRPAEHRREGTGSGSDRDNLTPKRPQRPTLDRRASAMPGLGRSTPPSSPLQSRMKPGQYSSDESENDAARRRAKNGPSSTLMTSNLDPKRHHERRASSRNPGSPPRTPTASDYPKSQGLNREALLNGAAASLNGLLDGPQRKASPRPSPQASPNSSPYPSPPRTPPEPHRMLPVASLKNEAPNSRPSSPLSSPTIPGSGRMPPASDQETTSRLSRPQPRSRATSPMPSSRRPEPELPKIDVRSPSPLPPKHGKSLSQENNTPQTPNRYMPAYATATLPLPSGPPERRQRSMSNSEGRSSRPTNLSINPPVIHQSDVEYLSPTSENTPSHFRSAQQNMGSLLSPTSTDRQSRDSLATSTNAVPRSHSAIPKPEHAVSNSSPVIPPASGRPRSRSSAPAPVPDIAYSDQRHPDPVQFPPCQHTKPMAGYRDWYCIDGCEAFVICRECRIKIFGKGFGRQFKYHTPPSTSTEIQCAINDPWMRMACLASILGKSNDLTPVINLAVENEGRSPCPQRNPAKRDWYYLRDPEADENLADFRVCSHCAYSIYTLFPTLDRIFKRGEKMDNEPLLCSIRSADPVRFSQYIKHCEKAEQGALKSGRRHPNMSDFIWYHKKETVISECTRDQVLIGRDWHKHPDIPQCTVCEECYYEIVRPQIKKGYEIARDITPVAKHINDGVSCTLYSPRMREVFKIACEDDDLKYLKNNVMSRWDLQVKILAAKMEVQKYPTDKEAQAELDHYMGKWHRMEKEKYSDQDSS